jgi:DNA replication protein DnaC
MGNGAVRDEANPNEFLNCPECFCERCDGTKFVRMEKGYSPCPACVLSKVPDRRMSQAGVPSLYRHADFESYNLDFASCSPGQKVAKLMVETFANTMTTASTGLLLYGSLGVGKTHLAIAAMKVRMDKGFSCRYYDGYSFIKLIQGTYGDRERGEPSEADVMDTAVKCDVLVLDDLGSFKVTDDRAEIMASVLNTRYLENRVTIITTNFAFERSTLGRPRTEPPAINPTLVRDTLGDRVGDRVMSRLEQMCVPLYISGPDMRSTVLKARMA